MKPYNFGCHMTFDQIISHINNSPVQGFEENTPEYIAASYAFESAVESGYIDQDNITLNLSILIDDGASFDSDEAYEQALEFANEYRRELESAEYYDGGRVEAQTIAELDKFKYWRQEA